MKKNTGLVRLESIVIFLVALSLLGFSSIVWGSETDFPKAENLPAPDASKYDFLETFSAPQINEDVWELQGNTWKPNEQVNLAKVTDNEFVKTAVVDGKLYLYARGPNNIAILRAKQELENNDFTLEYDLYPITEEKYCGMTMVSFPAQVGDVFKVITSHLTDGKTVVVQVFANYQGQLSIHLGGPGEPLQGNKWYHFTVQNHQDTFSVKIVNQEDGKTVFEKNFEHDEVEGKGRLTFAASAGEVPEIETLKARLYIDNICWKKGKP